MKLLSIFLFSFTLKNKQLNLLVKVEHNLLNRLHRVSLRQPLAKLILSATSQVSDSHS